MHNNKIDLCNFVRKKHIDFIETCVHPPSFFQHYAVFIPNSKKAYEQSIVSKGYNSMIKFRNYSSKHAEMDAYNKIKRKMEVPKTVDLIVIRINNSGVFGESSPCLHCLTYLNRIKKFTIKNIYHTTKDGILEKEKFSDMLIKEHVYISSGMKHLFMKKLKKKL